MSRSFSSASSPSYGDRSLHHPVFCSPAAPRGLLSDANGHVPPLPSSPPPYAPPSFPSDCYLHRSSSTHSLPLHHSTPDSLNLPHPPPHSSSPSSSSCDYLDFNAGSIRRVLSAGDLQGMNGLQENYRVGRYSAEERKERIERYRSKRNQRNFHKKITYACRKTLADSRPRVRGRFARNGEMETEPPPANSFDCFSFDNYEQNQSCSLGGDNGGDWRSQLQAALATDDEQESCYDEELLASFADVFSMNILS